MPTTLECPLIQRRPGVEVHQIKIYSFNKKKFKFKFRISFFFIDLLEWKIDSRSTYSAVRIHAIGTR